MRKNVIAFKDSRNNLSLDNGWVLELQVLGSFSQWLLDEQLVERD